MSTHRVRRRRQKQQLAPPEPKPDTCELDLRELAVLWPRLEAALARDGAGPSAAPSGSSSVRAGSPAVIDLDTERVMTLIELGVHELEAEAIRLLNITPAEKVLAAQRAELASLVDQRRAARAELGLVRTMVTRRRREAIAIRGRAWPVVATEYEQELAGAAIAAIAKANVESRRLAVRIARVEYRRSVEGVLEQLPVWYARLRDRKQPLAANIAKDVARWRRDARSVLRLRTREVPLGYACPHHRDEPAQLVRDRDEATLDDAILAGRATGALKWRFAESVHCPHCDTKWVGVEQLRVLMLMIERVELEEYMTEALNAALDDEHMAIALWRCGECGKTSSRDAWQREWWAERSRRIAGQGIAAEQLAEYQAEGTASKYGLDERDVCPRCKYVHADDEGPGIDEIDGVAVALPDSAES